MIDFVVSPKVFAVNCEIQSSQFTAEMLYLRETFKQEIKVNLYNGDRALVATVLIPATDIQVHKKITLEICR